MAIEQVDLAVIGAGFHGLSATATYLRFNPTSSVVIIDPAGSLGGVWAKERLYPGLKSNAVLGGTYELPSYPLDAKLYNLKANQHIPGEVVHDYLTRFAKHTGIATRARLRTRVDSVRKLGAIGHGAEGWELHLCSVASPNDLADDELVTLTNSNTTTTLLHAKKLIVATGILAEPFMPSFPGSATFDAPLFHVKELRKQSGLLRTVKHVAVLGGTKHAWDAAYTFATQSTAPDVQVHMIMRKSGHGPAWICPTHVTPLKQLLETLTTTRALTWLSPCIWAEPADGYKTIRRFLHGTSIGRWIVDSFFNILTNDLLARSPYDEHPETMKLKPWHPPFWFGTTFLGIANHETSFFELVKEGKIRVHIADIETLSPQAVHLSDGTVLENLDAFICSTGWKYLPPLKFIDLDPATLGLPHQSPKSHPLTDKADQEILSSFPRLASQPSRNPWEAKTLPTTPGETNAPSQINQPYRLWRFMVPPAFATADDRTLAFPGITSNVPTAFTAEIQALWITAWFRGDIKVTPQEAANIEYEATLHSRFGRWRAPFGHGAAYPDFVFDCVPYFDVLLEQLGLERWRKSSMGGWLPNWREWIVPYVSEDYRGLMDEYEQLVAGKKTR